MRKSKLNVSAKFSQIDIEALENAVCPEKTVSRKVEEVEKRVDSDSIVLNCGEEEKPEKRLNTFNVSRMKGVYTQVIDVPEKILKKEDLVEGIVLQPEERCVPVLSSLASVGIISDSYKVKPCFYPHGREIYLLPNLGEFSYKGETVEEFHFPTIGAEKFGKNTYQSIGVASSEGVIAQGVFSDIIDAAREKLDGEEVIVYSIVTRKEKVSFVWTPQCHRKMDFYAGSGHFEKVDQQLYFLSGENSLGGIVSEWEYLSYAMISRMKDKEGIIVRMSGKEYRLPWKHSATFLVKGQMAYDLSKTMTFPVRTKFAHFNYLSDGLYDFTYDKDKKEWTPAKKRSDKNHPDHVSGIMDMITKTATLSEFLENVALPKKGGISPSMVRVAPLAQSVKDRVEQLKDLSTVKIRVSGNYKQPDSYRRILVEDLSRLGTISSTSVVPRRPNVITSSGRVILFKRHTESILFRVGGKNYVTNYEYGKGKVKYLKLVDAVPYSLNLNGPGIRVYDYDDDEGDDSNVMHYRLIPGTNY